MIRYYLSPLIGAGTNEDPRRPAFTDTWKGNWVCMDGPDVALVLVNAPEPEHAILRQDNRLWAFPRLLMTSERPGKPKDPDRDDDLNHALQRPIPELVRKAIVAKALELGFDISWVMKEGYVFREVIREFGERIGGPGQRVDEMWVSE